MAEKSGFFNSVNGDRKYKADFFAEYFASFIGNGVFPNPSDNLQVIANDNMTVTVKQGSAWINGYFYVNDSDLILNIDNADGVLNRIDRIVLQYSTLDRTITAKIKKGTFDSSPIALILQRDADAYELGIADIAINAGATSITQANITDLRLSNDYCGVVTGTVDQIDTTTLFNQYQSWLLEKKSEYDTDLSQWINTKQSDYQAWYDTTIATEQIEIDAMEEQFQTDWDTWFATVQGALDGDVAGNLLNLINANTTRIKINQDKIDILENNIDNLNTNDIQARLEMEDLKRRLELAEIANLESFASKDDMGFFDYFDTTDNIDLANTTATVDTTAKQVQFPAKQNFTVKSVGDFTDATDIKVDGEVNVGDKINNILVNSVTSQEEITTNTVVDATVVASAYDTSKNARPQVLSNGWIVIAVYIPSSGIYFYKTEKGDWTDVEQLCYMGSGLSSADFSIVSSGNFIYVIGNNGYYNYFDATTVNNDNIGNLGLDTSQTALDSCSLAISPDKTTLWAAWASKNSTYPNSFNIRTCKGIIQLDGSVNWSSVEQITSYNTNGIDLTNPSIVVNSDNNPVTVYEWINLSSNYYIGRAYLNDSTWIVSDSPTANPVYYATYSQSSPDLIVDKNGVLLCVWEGQDSTESSNHIRFSKSTDDGLTWSAMEKLTSGSYNKRKPSITVNKNDEIFIRWWGVNSNSSPYGTIEGINNIDGVWGSILDITNKTTGSAYYPSTLFDPTFTLDFSSPLFIYEDNENSKVGFYGTWDTVKEQFYPVLNQVISTVDNEELTVIPNPFSVLQMNQETFDTFNSIELRLYPEIIQKATISGTVTSSTSVTIGATDRPLVTGDKLWIGNIENEIVGSTGNSINHNIQNATVTPNVYETNSKGALVQLENGWLVAGFFNDPNIGFSIYKPEEENPQWVELPLKTNYGAEDGFFIVSKGNTIHVLTAHDANIQNHYMNMTEYDGVATNFGTNVGTIDTGRSNMSGCSLAISQDKTTLHACWGDRDSTRPNSFNIRYAKGTINQDNSVTWSSAEQITSYNTNGINLINPSIVVNSDNNPVIVYEWINSSSNFYIGRAYFDSSNWIVSDSPSANPVYYAFYAQSSPSAIFVPQSVNGLANGRIWVAWHGQDSIDDNIYHIRVSYSDDGGVTWSAMEKLTSLTTSHNIQPSITCNKDNKVFITFITNNNSQTTYYVVRKISNISGVWNSPSIVTPNTSNNSTHPSTLFDQTFTLDFSEPLFIYQDGQNSKVGFYGTWTIEQGYNLTLTNPVTLTDQQQIPIVDFNVEQASTAMTLNGIDTEKYEFSAANLATTTADIKINGQQNNLNSMVYAIS
ncbi:hypothetical protein [Wukongibacter sp. M2B1]|uniref:sialidase family protein n=1 Tax=Wukongibacter sp. M2B1 TaxID=3088895 RepID=UPI003D7A21A9